LKSLERKHSNDLLNVWNNPQQKNAKGNLQLLEKGKDGAEDRRNENNLNSSRMN